MKILLGYFISVFAVGKYTHLIFFSSIQRVISCLPLMLIKNEIKKERKKIHMHLYDIMGNYKYKCIFKVGHDKERLLVVWPGYKWIKSVFNKLPVEIVSAASLEEFRSLLWV